MKIAIIVAQSINRAIGRYNQLLWHLPEDLKYFKSTTSGHCVAMGRKTFDSIGRLLPNRTNIVISRNADLLIEGARVVSSLERAIEMAEELDETVLYVIGGGEIYRQALPIADLLHVTCVSDEVEGDTFFPDIDPLVWTVIKENYFSADLKHKFPFVIRVYAKNI
jgi:dihydrofolate reductase